MARTGAQAIAWARQHMTHPPGLCLQWVRMSFDVDPFFYDAADAWRGANYRHPTNSGRNCPRGVPVYWVGGSSGHGHIALSVGGGYCLSTDAAGAGRCAKVGIDDLTRRWGHDFVGWAEDVNHVRVFDVNVDKPAAGWDRVRMSALDRGERNKDIAVVKFRLRNKVGPGHMDFDRYSDHWGDAVTDSYRQWQRRLGFSGAAADGRPGAYSLRKLDLEVVDAS